MHWAVPPTDDLGTVGPKRGRHLRQGEGNCMGHVRPFQLAAVHEMHSIPFVQNSFAGRQLRQIQVSAEIHFQKNGPMVRERNVP